jgi:hypothetical protein
MISAITLSLHSLFDHYQKVVVLPPEQSIANPGLARNQEGSLVHSYP